MENDDNPCVNEKLDNLKGDTIDRRSPFHRNPWLFANGKFGYEDENNERIPLTPTRLDDLIDRDISHIRLVARRIDDMVLDEFLDIASELGEEALLELERKANDNELSFKEARVLLKHGLYPFDQWHFKDGTVTEHRQSNK